MKLSSLHCIQVTFLYICLSQEGQMARYLLARCEEKKFFFFISAKASQVKFFTEKEKETIESKTKQRDEWNPKETTTIKLKMPTNK